MAIYSSSSNGTWSTWTTTSTTSTASTTSTYSSDPTWGYWTSSGTATTSSSAWVKWTDGGNQDQATISYGQGKSCQTIHQVPKLTDEEIADIKAAQAKYEVEAEERQKKRDEAIEKSRKLLVSLLDKYQAEQLEKKGEFGYVGPSGALYTIRKGISGNIIKEKEGKRTRLCCHTKDRVPVYDNMASQLIWLKFCEEEFVKLANETHL
jgi:hypothetical protein